MGLILPGQPNEEVIFSIPAPSSFAKLPAPQPPDAKHIKYAQDIERSLVQHSGLKPGCYLSLDSETYTSVKRVYDGLVDSLLEELFGLDVTDICIALYKRLEQLLGYIHVQKYKAIPNLMLAGYSGGQDTLQQVWAAISPYTEAIRWLIEICIKRCESSGTRVDNTQLGRLIEITRIIFAWDGVWEHINYGVLGHEFVVSQDLSVSSRPTSQTTGAMEAYDKAMASWRVEADREWMNTAFAIKDDEDVNKTDVDEMEIESFELLDAPMTSELGYNMKDWLRYSAGLMRSFDYDEYIKIIPKNELADHLLHTCEIDQGQIDLLLTDHAVSKETVAECSLYQLRPVQFARRHTRLFRRPVVLIEQSDKSSLCVYGIETLWYSVLSFPQYFMSGQVNLPRMAESGPVRTAIGKIQSDLGHVFRDEVAQTCTNLGYETKKEKRSVGTTTIPNGMGFGPVDIFLVDRKFNRFILIETKDTESYHMRSKKMQADLKQFRTHIDKMQQQVSWFRDRMESLKREFGIECSENFAVVGVIVISRPRLWMYTTGERFPILTDRDFFDSLVRGEILLSSLQ